MLNIFSAAPTKDTRREAAWLAAKLARAKEGRRGDLETEVVMVTPSLAEIMLRANDDNRPLRKSHVNNIAGLIREGRWRLTSQGISFSREGKLNNGQHRLTAVIEAGVSVPMMVTFGEDRDIFPMLDTGKLRSGGDALHIAGYTYWIRLSAAAKLFQSVTSANPLVVSRPNPEDVLATIGANKGMEEVCTEAALIAKKLKCSSASAIVALYLIRQKSKHADRLAEFAHRLATGEELKRRDPILTLRNAITERSFDSATRGGSGIAATAVQLCAAIILAWNRWVKGNTATVPMLQWRETQAFPIPE